MGERWEVRLHRGLYHVLLAGAVVSGVYNAPFLQAEKDGRTEFLERCTRCHPHPGRPSQLTAEDLQYLRSFPVYDISAGNSKNEIRNNTEYATIYRPLVEYLIKEGTQDGLREQLEHTRIDEHDEHHNGTSDRFARYSSEETGSIREIKTFLGAYEYFYRKVYRTDYSRVGIAYSSTTLPNFEGQRKLTAVVFGRFQLEDIFLPTIAQDAERGFLLARATSRSLELANVDIQHISQHVLRSDPLAPDGFPRLPLAYKFFSFSLKSYFKLKWKPNTFESEIGHEDWMEELRYGHMFQGPHLDPWKFNHPDSLVFDPDAPQRV